MPTSILISLAIFVFVVFNVCARAYRAYAEGYKTWPILAVLAALYIILLVIRFATHFANPIFFVVSFIVLIISRIVYSSSRAAGG